MKECELVCQIKYITMKDLKLTLYDWLGYLTPGSILIISIYLTIKDGKILDKFNIVDSTDYKFVEGIVFFFFAYLIGHIIHAIANLTIDKLPYGKYASKEYYENNLTKDISTTQQKAIIDILKEKFMLEVTDDQKYELKKNYWLCFYDVVDNVENSLSQTFLNINGFYRGTLVSTFIASLIFIIYSMTEENNLEFLFLGFILIIFSILLYQRTKRFKNYLTKAVYFEFLSLNKKSDKKS